MLALVKVIEIDGADIGANGLLDPADYDCQCLFEIRGLVNLLDDTEKLLQHKNSIRKKGSVAGKLVKGDGVVCCSAPNLANPWIIHILMRESY